ncbi:MAG: carbohydrate kinase family protein [Clostridiales Family XIII bacterium]|jgi:sugar/nucleoside kinase (ribokinase family)|nr:carbohydrate kinase family protein [Clostridiales Family XIII bacterium]
MVLRKKIIVAGHICLDITPAFPAGSARSLAEVLSPGKLVQVAGVDLHTGGAVANTGLAMKFFGADVRLLGKIGDDEFGQIILGLLKRYGYDGDQDMIVSHRSPTSYSVVLALPGVDRIFLHNPGANDTFCYEDLDFGTMQGAEHFHFGYPPLMRKIYAEDGDELVKIFEAAKKFGLATSLDMAAVDPASDAGKADWRKILERVLPFVDFFMPSVEELCFMLDRERYESWNERAEGSDITGVIDIEREVKPLAKELEKMGATGILIKCGSLGLYYKTADKEGFKESYKPQKVVSGTGAGDISIAAFLVSMLSGKSLERSVELMAAAGATCVESYDALSGLKSLEELEDKIDSGW